MSEKRDDSVGSNVLFLDTIFFHKVETDTPKKPKKPLTKAEKARLWKNVYKKCRAAYINGMVKSGLKNAAYDYDDLEQDSWIHFDNILNKFDKSAYGKNIGKIVVEGAKGSKTLEWFFYNYYCWRLNWTKKDNRNLKEKKQGKEQYNPSAYVDVEGAASTSAPPFISDALKLLSKEVESKSPEFQEFFKRKVILQEKVPLLRKEFANYKDLSHEVKVFLNDFMKRNTSVLQDEIGSLKKVV